MPGSSDRPESWVGPIVFCRGQPLLLLGGLLGGMLGGCDWDSHRRNRPESRVRPVVFRGGELLGLLDGLLGRGGGARSLGGRGGFVGGEEVHLGSLCDERFCDLVRLKD